MSDKYPPIETWTPREHQIYEVGYEEGGDSTNADWFMALSEGLDIEAESITEAIEKIRGRIHTPPQT